MWCKQHPTCALLQYMRQPTINCPSSHTPPDGLYSASRPTILCLPVSRKLLGGRANKQDNNSLTGLLLLVIGALIAWIPFAGFIGGIVGFIGGILVLVGREPFGTDHVRNTTLALIFFVVGIAVTIFGFFYALAYGASSGFGASVVGLFGIVFLIGGAIFGLSEVLLTYSLQRSNAHTLLWTAYGISIFLGLVNIFILPFGSGGFWTLYFGTGVLLFTGFLAAIPAALYGTAFYLARERIVRHEIPPPMTQQPGKPPW